MIQPRYSSRIQQGLTLIEILVTMVIVGVLAAMAVPAFEAYSTRNQIQSLGNEFTASIMRARGEAISKNTCVTLCMSSTVDATGGAGTSAGPRCATSGSDWQVGWIAFLNPECDQTLNFPRDGDGTARPENMLFYKRQAASDLYLNSQGSSATRRFLFNPQGSPGLSGANEFDLVYRTTGDPLTLKYGFNICIDALGRTRNIDSSSSCSN